MPSLKIAASSGASVAVSRLREIFKSVVNKVTSSVEMLRTGKFKV